MKNVYYTLSNWKTGKCDFLEVNYENKSYRLIKNVSDNEYENPEHLKIEFEKTLSLYIDIIKKNGFKELTYNIDIESIDLTDELLDKLNEKICFEQNNVLDAIIESMYADIGTTYTKENIVVDDPSYILNDIKMSVLHLRGMISVTDLDYIAEDIYFIKNTIICIGENRKTIFKNKNSTILQYEEKSCNGMIKLRLNIEFEIDVKENISNKIKSYIDEYNQKLLLELNKSIKLNNDLYHKHFDEYKAIFTNYIETEDVFSNLTIEKFLGIIRGLKDYPNIYNFMNNIEIKKSGEKRIRKIELSHFQQLNLYFKKKLNIDYIIYPFLYLSLYVNILSSKAKKWLKYDDLKEENLISYYCEDASIDPLNEVNLFSFSCYLFERDVLETHVIYELYAITKGLVDKELKQTSTQKFFDKLEFGVMQNNISLDEIDEMSGKEFEDYLIGWFSSKGLSVDKTKMTGDQGIDILLSNAYEKIGIQCKRWKSKVGNSAIQEAYAGAEYYKCDKAVVITNNYFTKEAISLSTQIGVELWDRDVLERKLALKSRKEKKI